MILERSLLQIFSKIDYEKVRLPVCRPAVDGLQQR
jgi:hypothetical protein